GVLPSDLFKQLHLASPVHWPPRPLCGQGRPFYAGWAKSDAQSGPNQTTEIKSNERFIIGAERDRIIDRSSAVIRLPINIHRRCEPRKTIHQLNIRLPLYWFSLDVEKTVSIGWFSTGTADSCQ